MVNVWSMPASLSFCLTNDNALAVSASYRAIELSGLDGKARRIIRSKAQLQRSMPTFGESLGVLPVVANNNDMRDL